MSDFSFRPFGSLPLSVPTANKYILFSAAIFVGFLVVIHTAWLSMVLYKKWSHYKNLAQRNNIILLILAGVGLTLGLVDVSDSTWNYTSGQSLFSVVLGFVCWAGFSFFLLPALFVSPHFKDETISSRKILAISSALMAVVGVALQIVVIAKGEDTPYSVILTLFVYKLSVLTFMLFIGGYFLLVSREQAIALKTKRTDESEGHSPIKPRRIALLVLGYLVTGGYVAFNGIEGPHSLVMRLMELVMLAGALGISFIFAASVEATIYNIVTTLEQSSASEFHRLEDEEAEDRAIII